jgi:hypothetical protein
LILPPQREIKLSFDGLIITNLPSLKTRRELDINDYYISYLLTEQSHSIFHANGIPYFPNSKFPNSKILKLEINKQYKFYKDLIIESE